MKYFTRKMIAHKDLNSNGTLFGGRVLDWIDEEAYIYCSCQLDNDRVVTRAMSNIDFHHSACLLYTSPSPRDVEESRMPSSA